LELKKKFARNIGSGSLAKIAQSLIGFLLITYVIKSVGIEKWGILTLSVSVISLLSIIQAGISGGTSKRLSDYFYSDDFENFNKYYSGTLLVIYFLVILIAAILLLYAYFFLPSFVDEDVITLKYVFYLTTISTLLQIFKLPFIATLQALNRVDIIANIMTLGFVFRTLLVLTLFLLYKTIVMYSFILVLEFGLHVFLTRYYTKKHTGDFLKINFKEIEISYLLEIFRFNIYNFLNSLNYVFFVQLPSLIVASRYGLTFSGYYGLGVQLNNLFRGFLNILSNAMRPVFNILKTKNKIEELKKYFNLSNKLFFIVGVGVVVLSSIFIEDILIIWLGEEVNKDLVDFIQYFLIFTAIGILFIPSALLIITFEKLKFTTFLGLFLSGLCGCILYFFDSPISHYVFVPLVITVLFLIYNLNRMVIIFKLLEMTFYNNLRLFTYTVLTAGSILAYKLNFNIGYDSIFLILIYSLSSLFLLKKEDYHILKSLFKK